MKRTLSIGLAIAFGAAQTIAIALPSAAHAQQIAGRVRAEDSQVLPGDWLIPAGIGGAGVIIHQQLNNGGSAVPPMRIEPWDDKAENRHWVASGGEEQCRKMGRKNGFGRLIRFIPGKNPGEGTCVFEGKQRGF